MTKFFKGRNKQKATPVPAPQPRELKEIQAEYNQLKSQAGEVQYQIYALKSNLEQMNQRLLQVNHEAAAHQKLDQEAAKAAEAPKAE